MHATTSIAHYCQHDCTGHHLSFCGTHVLALVLACSLKCTHFFFFFSMKDWAFCVSAVLQASSVLESVETNQLFLICANFVNKLVALPTALFCWILFSWHFCWMHFLWVKAPLLGVPSTRSLPSQSAWPVRHFKVHCKFFFFFFEIVVTRMHSNLSKFKSNVQKQTAFKAFASFPP